jgi:phage shock protein PspC (stress-responsive transcriptional regulator)
VNRKLYRSRTDTILGGVAAGLATYMSADTALVRIAWAVLVPLTGGIAFLAYIVGWVVIPEEPSDYVAAAASGVAAAEPGADGAPAAAPPTSPRSSTGSNPGVWVGVALVLLGAWFLFRQYMPSIDWGLIWPLFIVVIGIVIVVTATRRSG